MNPSKSHSLRLTEPRLFSVILNFGEERSIARALVESDVARFAKIVSNRGGKLPDEVGCYELGIIPADGYTIIGLKRERVPIAMAGLATKQFAGEILWDELLQQHVRMLRAQGRPVRSNLQQIPPDSLPWLQISLSPGYVDKSLATDLHRTLSLLWASAFACLGHLRSRTEKASS